MNTHKHEFLKKYNPQRSVDVALSAAISAAVQHNSLYRPGLEMSDRLAVRHTWREQLRSFVDRYKQAQSDSIYEGDIERLKDSMNGSHRDAFYSEPHPKFFTDPGFRISHAQKSISVFLKHLWCMEIIVAPPQCPVDRVILEAAGRRYPDTDRA